MVDKVRIKKYQQSKVKQWSVALEIPEPRFIEDAINFYLKHLEGKLQIEPTVTAVSIIQPNPVIETNTEDDNNDSLDDFTGGIEL